jgi:ABC-2 type transport system permease protein
MAESIRNIRAIASKEIRGYFVSPMAWTMMGLFALIFGYFYLLYVNSFVEESMRSMGGGQFGGPQPVNVNMRLIRPLLSNASVIVLFLLPMITMRTYSEEKRSGTIELLLTSPLKDFEIVIGKFLGAIGLYGALIGVTMLYVGILFAYGDPEPLPVLSGYIGLFLLGGCFISMGLFISSTTKNQMVAGTATFVFSLLFWIIGWASDMAGGWFGSVLGYLSITQHFDDFGKGIIDTKHLVFYLSFITFWLFLTIKSVDSERWRG